MHLAVLILTYLFALIISNVLNRMFPRIPLPLVQIALGSAIAWITATGLIEFESEIFLAFVIAPLLFREGEESDITSVLRHWKLIVYLIFPVVFVTALAIGWSVERLSQGALPLAACFALGAALGPTDLVAFSAISERFSFPKYIENVLQGEGLLNDASGLVSFQVAVTVLTTGIFSATQAGFSLFVSVVGGFLIGLAVAFVNRFLLSVLDNVDAADVRGALLLELALPIVAYFLAEEIHGSGIIAVVVAGISQASRFKKITLFDARLDQVTTTIWRTATFMLNGLVFILLGEELTILARPVFDNDAISTWGILGLIVLVTVILFVTRYLMLSLFFFWRSKRSHRSFSRYLREIAILTFSGVKGTVSIATILLLPAMSANQYSILLFIVAGTTLLSFLTGVLVLPHLAQPKQEERPIYAEIGILTEVVQELHRDMATTLDKVSLYAVIDSYNQRIENLIIEQESREIKADMAMIRLMTLGIESDGLEHAFASHELGIKEYRSYQRYLRSLERQINRNFVSNLTYAVAVAFRAIPALLHELVTFGANIRRFFRLRESGGFRLTDDERSRIRDLYLTNSQLIMESLDQLDGIYNSELIAYLKRERRQEMAVAGSVSFSDRILARVTPPQKTEVLRGFYLERKAIAEYEANELISHRYSKILRQQVNALENYALSEKANTLTYDILNFARQR